MPVIPEIMPFFSPTMSASPAASIDVHAEEPSAKNIRTNKSSGMAEVGSVYRKKDRPIIKNPRENTVRRLVTSDTRPQMQTKIKENISSHRVNVPRRPPSSSEFFRTKVRTKVWIWLRNTTKQMEKKTQVR